MQRSTAAAQQWTRLNIYVLARHARLLGVVTRGNLISVMVQWIVVGLNNFGSFAVP